MNKFTLKERADFYSKAFPDWPPLRFDNRWLDGVWILGNDYRNKTSYYGCLGPETRVLTASLEWKTIKSLQKGDFLVGFNEYPLKGGKRKLCRSEIIDIGPVKLPSYELTFENGVKIIASEDHMWLEQNNALTWQITSQLEEGRSLRKVVDVWDVSQDTFDIGWLSGIIDGEGWYDSFASLRIGIAQNTGDVLLKIEKLLSLFGISYGKGKHKNSKTHQLHTMCAQDALHLLGITHPVRFEHVWENTCFGIKFPSLRLIKKKYVGEKHLIGITTSTQTFVAEGLASHNSYPPQYLKRIQTLFPDAKKILHLCSGSLPKGDYIRFDIRKELQPDVVGDVHKLSSYFPKRKFDLIYADIPYSEEDALHYGTPMVKRKTTLQQCAKVLEKGGNLVWLDQALPQFAKKDFHWWGLIAIQRSSNHRIRGCYLFEKV